jgi:hypothetical protein
MVGNERQWQCHWRLYSIWIPGLADLSIGVFSEGSFRPLERDQFSSILAFWGESSWFDLGHSWHSNGYNTTIKENHKEDSFSGSASIGYRFLRILVLNPNWSGNNWGGECSELNSLDALFCKKHLSWQFVCSLTDARQSGGDARMQLWRALSRNVRRGFKPNHAGRVTNGCTVMCILCRFR